MKSSTKNSTPNKKSPQPNKSWKTPLIVSLIIISFFLLAYLILAINLAGGLSGFISNLMPAPDPNSSGVIAKRNAAKDSLNAAFTELEGKVGFPSYGASTHDVCYRGENNYKRQEGYGNRCTYRITKFYGFNGDFKQQMIDFEEELFGLQWKTSYSSQPTIKDIMKEYYDGSFTDKSTSMSQESGNGERYFSLPAPGRYLKNGDVLEINYADKETTDFSTIEYDQGVAKSTILDPYNKSDFQDIPTLAQKITQTNNFILVVSIEQNYFQN